MPFFKTTENILRTPWDDELYNENWMDSDKLVLPPSIPWDYHRELQIEDVDIWEQIYYQGGGLGLYASWSPYAEFYMIVHHLFMYKNNSIETFYGKGAGKKAYLRGIELGMPLSLNTVFINDDEMWLYDH